MGKLETVWTATGGLQRTPVYMGGAIDEQRRAALSVKRETDYSHLHSLTTADKTPVSSAINAKNASLSR
jgi:putative AlgH/UPF0301 family transcriptional regulator